MFVFTCLGPCTQAAGINFGMAEGTGVCWFIPQANRVALSGLRGGTAAPTYFSM